MTSIAMEGFVEDFEDGDTAICPHCGKEFEITDAPEDEPDGFDIYFEHVTTCERGWCK